MTVPQILMKGIIIADNFTLPWHSAPQWTEELTGEYHPTENTTYPFFS